MASVSQSDHTQSCSFKYNNKTGTAGPITVKTFSLLNTEPKGKIQKHINHRIMIWGKDQEQSNTSDSSRIKHYRDTPSPVSSTKAIKPAPVEGKGKDN